MLMPRGGVTAADGQDAGFVAASLPQSSLRSEAAPVVSSPRRTIEAESWWEQWSLAGAAVFCWLFLALALIAGHFTAAPPLAVTALFALSYLAGGTFATSTALRSLFLERTVSVDFLMITAAIGAAIVGHWEEGAICSASSRPRTRSSTTPWGGRGGPCGP